MAIISLVTVFFIILTVETALLPFFSLKPISREAVLWLGLCGFTVLLIIAQPRFLWTQQSPFSGAQFPYRYLVLLELLSLSLLLTVLRDLGPRRALWTRMFGMRMCAVGLGSVLIAWTLMSYYQGRDLNDDRKLSINTNWQSNEYLPATITGDFETTGNVERRLRHSAPPPLLHIDGDGMAQLIKKRGGTFVINVESSVPTTLHVRQFAFPGWHAINTENGSQPPLSSWGDNATLTIAVPAGGTLIRLSRSALPQEIWGWVLALIGMLGLVGGSIRLNGWPEFRRET
jgi:hypothetical protein